jgi:hypothetical protein
MSGIVAQNILDSTGLIKASSGGAVGLTFISKQTASGSANISFTSGIDSTYKKYVFYFKNMHPASENPNFAFNLSIDSGSNYNVAKTTTFFRTQHGESGSGAELGYEASLDLAQGTGIKKISQAAGNDNDQGVSGYLCLFNPSSTTFVKNFIAQTNNSFKYSEPYVYSNWTAGYGNTTSAVDAIQFSFSSGNIDSGQISLYGLTT